MFYFKLRLICFISVYVRGTLRAGWPGLDPGFGGGEDYSSLLRVQTGPGVHSASYKMSIGGGGLSPRVKAAEHRTSHPTSS